MKFLTTGGTIDKLRVLTPEGRFNHDSKKFNGTALPKILTRLGIEPPYDIEELFAIDSWDMTPEHREQILAAIEASQQERIVITHGTDTMPETASFLKASRAVLDRTVFLVGAMQPYSMGAASDATRNVGFAVQRAAIQPNGVYIAMNKQVFEADRVYKDRDAKVFRSL